MKISLSLLLLAITQICNAQFIELPTTDPNPGQLKAKIHLSSKQTSDALPLVVVLHGCYQDAEKIAHDADWNRLSDSIGFHVLYPEQLLRNNLSSCYNWFIEKDIKKNSGEVYSIYLMIEQVQKSYAIDKSKIFVYGVSAGGAMASALLVDYPETFNAGAVLAGAPFGIATNAGQGMSAMINPKDLKPSEWATIAKQQNPGYKGTYPRIVVMHGTGDDVVSVKAGFELVEQFLALNDCAVQPTTSTKAFQKNEAITKLTYSNKANEERVVFYEFNKWGHFVPVDPGNGPLQGGQLGMFAKDVDFFSTIWILKDWGLINP